jgi:hypothetical protein
LDFFHIYISDNMRFSYILAATGSLMLGVTAQNHLGLNATADSVEYPDVVADTCHAALLMVIAASRTLLMRVNFR